VQENTALPPLQLQLTLADFWVDFQEVERMTRTVQVSGAGQAMSLTSFAPVLTHPCIARTHDGASSRRRLVARLAVFKDAGADPRRSQR
jgi:hypothetical protein